MFVSDCRGSILKIIGWWRINSNLTNTAVCSAVLLAHCPAHVLAQSYSAGLQAAARQENAIQTGLVFMKVQQHHPKVPEQETLRRSKNPHAVERQLQLEKSWPEFKTVQYTIRFDHQHDVLLVQSTSDQSPVSEKIRFTAREVRSTTEFRNPRLTSSVESTVRRAKWLPPWPHSLWLGRFWEQQLKLMRDGHYMPPRQLTEMPATGLTLLLFPGGSHEHRYMKLWLDYKQGFTPVKLQFIEKGNNRLQQERLISWKMYDGRIWYPQEMVETIFRYDDHGQRKILLQTTSHVERASFNIPTSEKDLAFGDFPYGCHVQDNRFQPPLAYYQGDKQFTDEELLDTVAKGQRVPNYARITRTQSSRFPFIVFPLAFSLLIISVMIVRKMNRKTFEGGDVKI